MLVKNYFDIICIIRIIFIYFQYSVYCIKKKKIEMFNGDIMILSTILVLMINDMIYNYEQMPNQIRINSNIVSKLHKFYIFYSA